MKLRQLWCRGTFWSLVNFGAAAIPPWNWLSVVSLSLGSFTLGMTVVSLEWRSADECKRGLP